MDPGYIFISYQKSDLRENTGVLPSGGTVNFYETYIADINSFNEKFQEVTSISGKSIANIAAVSMDAIFSPYSTSYASGDFPHFEAPTSTTVEPNSLYLNPFNPYNSLRLPNPTGVNASGWAASGHNIMFASVGTGVGNVLTSGSGLRTNPESLVFDADFYSRGRVESSSIRPVGLRSPMVLTGWGFDTDGKPVPADPNDSDKFHPQAFTQPNLWKSGPVDLRFDNDRKVWTGGNSVKFYLIKVLNEYTPACFSYEVDYNTSRAQYTRAQLTAKAYNSGNFPETGILDPETIAYNANPLNSGCFERLSYAGGEYPYYEAYILRETNLDPNPSLLYNVWADDCSDCGHISNRCDAGTNHGDSATNKKILIENPLRQSFNVGDLAFSVKTGRKKQVYSGGFSAGSGVGASGQFTTTGGGVLSFTVTNGGSNFTHGAFATYVKPCVGLELTVVSGVVTSGTISGSTTGYLGLQTWPVTIIAKNASPLTEELDIHWITQSEFKSQQVVVHCEANAGILQTVTAKIQTQGFKSCLHGGESSVLVNSFI